MAQQPQTTWTRSSWTDAAQLVVQYDPRRKAGESAGHSPPDWFAHLRQANKLFDALVFVAHALPRYECVVWATRVLMDLGAVDRNDPLMVAVLRWIDEPGDELRRAAADLADAESDDTPARDLAKAVGFSGGSMAPPDLPPIQPPPDMTAKFAYAAVLEGALAQPDRNAAMNKALDLAEAMANGQ